MKSEKQRTKKQLIKFNKKLDNKKSKKVINVVKEYKAQKRKNTSRFKKLVVIYAFHDYVTAIGLTLSCIALIALPAYITCMVHLIKEAF